MLFPVLVGYDLAAEGGVKAMLDEFDQQVGLHYLRAIHLNDSKGPANTKTIQTEINKMVYILLQELASSLSLA